MADRQIEVSALDNDGNTKALDAVTPDGHRERVWEQCYCRTSDPDMLHYPYSMGHPCYRPSTTEETT
ncbi:MAG TPA: hypothetical protein VHX38_18640 [Pseudonocardiaceae bacterium]|jgi:hypothetical protein|nr:hypothetical protein [Pseudonocardiaceae bacterium]